MLKIAMNDYPIKFRDSDTYNKVHACLINFVKTMYGDAYPRDLAWNLSRKLHIPAYVIFRVCMDLVFRGELVMHHDKVRGGSRVPSYSNLPELHGSFGRTLMQGELYKNQSRGRWDFFRELVAYYIECVRLEEGSTAHAWQDSLGEQFLFLSETGRWYPRDNVLWRKTLPFADASGTLRDLWRDSDTTTLMLGYPVSASVGQDGSVYLRPVFCYVLDHRFTSAGLEVRARLTRPSVNKEWLERAFSRGSGKRAFLEACGMFAAADGDDDDGSGGTDGFADDMDDAPDFFRLAQVLSSADERHVQETLDPRCLSDRPVDPADGSGIYNRAVIMACRCSIYTKGLVSELQTIAKMPDEVLDGTALAHVFAEGTPPAEKVSYASGAVAAGRPLTGTQRRASASLLTSPLTVIQGPPGTGKSQVVAGAVFNARLRGQSVLISSYNHKAIDAVMDRLDPMTQGSPLVARCNDKADPNLSFGMGKGLKAMLFLPEGDRTDVESLAEFCRLLDRRGERSLVADEVEKLGLRLGELDEAMDTYVATRPHLSDFSERDLEELSLYREAAFLARECEDRTAFRTFFLRGRPWALWTLYRAGKALRRHWKKGPSYSWSADMKPFAEVFEDVVHVLGLTAQRQECEERLKSMPSLEALSDEVAGLDKLVKAQLPGVKRREAALREHLPQGLEKSALKGLEKALSSAKSALASVDVLKLLCREFPEKLPVIFHAFPCWAVTSLSVGRYIPLVPALFDLVLIDEASQSNIPSAIPLLFRAKRAGVIGDPRQLRFVSHMTADREALLQRELHMTSMKDLRFTFADNSLYDLASGSDIAETFLLDCTFRSSWDIAAYSNRLFYGGRLQVGTDERRLNRPKGASGAVEWRCVQGSIYRGAGQRSCWCGEEVEEVVELVRELLVTAQFEGTIGIVTPFREQAQRIEDRLEISGIDRELLRRAGVHVDTAHGFQGDERDVMIFSLCGGDDLTGGALHFLRENPNLFNVAVSRARAMLYMVGDREWAAHCGMDHIELLAEPARLRPVPAQKTKWYPYESPYEKLLAEALQQAGLDPLPQVPVGYRRLDLALRDPALPECRLDIEVDGSCHRDAGGHRKSDDLWRTLELNAAGWRVIRFWTYELRENLPGCVARVQKEWNEMREQQDSKAEA